MSGQAREPRLQERPGSVPVPGLCSGCWERCGMGGNSPVGNGGPRDPQEVRQCQVQGPAQGSERSQNRLGGDGSGAHAEAAVPSLELLFAVTSTPSWGKQRSDTGMSHLFASPAGCWWQECSPATDLQQHSGAGCWNMQPVCFRNAG